ASAELSEEDLADLLEDYKETLRNLCRHIPMPLSLGRYAAHVSVERLLRVAIEDEGPCSTILEADHA
ncbi:MAG: hypothetical protein AB7E46_15090, partial [Desulfovibrio sp.]